MKIIGMLLGILAVLHAPVPAQSQSAAPQEQQDHQDQSLAKQPQMIPTPPSGSGPEFKKWLNDNVPKIIIPEERKEFSSRPSPGPPSLRAPGGEKTPGLNSDAASAVDSATAHSLDQGDSEIILGHGPAAAEIFQKVLDNHPGQPRARFGLAVASTLTGKADVAKDLFEKLAPAPAPAKSGAHGSDAQVDPLIVSWSHVYLGRIHELEGDKNAAVAEYQAALAVVDIPDSAHEAAQRGIDYHKALDQAEASAQAQAASPMDPEEEAAYTAFNAITNNDQAGADNKIQLGQNFLEKYPSSRYTTLVYRQLLFTHYYKQDWNGFYATADKILASDPDDVDVLTVVGWVIPHQYYNRQNAGAAEKLNQAEAYEKHAIELIPSIPKPDGFTDEQFAQAKAERLSQAHSGLGLVYFRAEDFGNAARELQLSVQGAASPDPTDLYTLGVVMHQLGRNIDAADAFTKCSLITGGLQDRCKQSAGAVKNMK